MVLDNSLSTSAVVGGRPVLQQLQARAREILRRTSASDRVWLVTADGVVHGGSRDAVLDAAAHTEPFGGAGDLRAATSRAAALVRAAALPAREIVVLTDGQATSWRDPLTLGDVPLHAYLPAAQRARESRRHRRARDPRAMDAARRRARAVPRLRFGDVSHHARGTHARARDRGARRGDPCCAPSRRSADGMRGRWSWSPTSCAATTCATSPCGSGPRPRCRCIRSPAPFARSALDALVQSGRASIGNEIAFAPADEATKLPALLIAPADPVKLGAANRALERLGIPWRFGAAVRGESVVRAADSTRALDGVTVLTRYALSRVAGAPGGDRVDTLATAGGAPWIVAGPRYVLVASPLAPPATTFPLHATFVPWLDDMLSQRSERRGRRAARGRAWRAARAPR